MLQNQKVENFLLEELSHQYAIAFALVPLIESRGVC